jgi:hypothetical protein
VGTPSVDQIMPADTYLDMIWKELILIALPILKPALLSMRVFYLSISNYSALTSITVKPFS